VTAFSVVVAVIVGTAGIITALGVLWTKLIKPGAKAASTWEQAQPALDVLADMGPDVGKILSFLADIAAQFRTNSGSSLKDAINRLEVAGAESKAAIDEARALITAMQIIAGQDRQQMVKLFVVVDRLQAIVEEGAATSLRIEEGAAGVAADLVAANVKVEGVASDLEASHQRADETTGRPGEASDAASRSPQPPGG